MIEKLSRKLALVFMDMVWGVCSVYISLYIMLGSHLDLEKDYTRIASSFLPILLITVAILVIVNLAFKLYSIKWQYASIKEMLRIFFAQIAFNVVLLIITQTIASALLVPFRVHIFFAVIITVGIMAIRMSYRVLRYLQHEYVRNRGGIGGRIVIVGAGESGTMLISDINRNPERGQVVALIDDSKEKHNANISGVRVMGGTDDILEVCENVDASEIIISLPSADSYTVKQILKKCIQTQCRISLMPSVREIMGGEASTAQLRAVEPEDLLGRDPVDLDVQSIAGYITEKTVLVTGAGGSIGSELCRQIAQYDPKCLVLFDIYENSVFELRHELRRRHIERDIEVVIGSVRDAKRLDVVFNHFKPQIVFHAAAHKHVPLMEFSPGEAVKNNIFGTFNTAQAANKHGVERFVMISTDKAVNPTNIMGATKRVAEMVVSAINAQSTTEYTAVRFGNVLGSNGSVIPLFKKQIERGGPVTVTHPDITRYFMTIPEAAQLVLQAGGLADDGTIFVLDMGDMVKIDDLARDLIKLAGLVPGDDIKIVYTGLRPGEKMYEELLLDHEELEHTQFEKIFIGKPEFYEYNRLLKKLDKLKSLLDDDDGKVIEYIKSIVPEFGIISDELKNKEDNDAVKIYHLKNRKKTDVGG
ncbi:MAG: polysaccharide biosynthesis protein [Clostridiales bacterium]|nr:polysaccharide biosynthesis protein [Clostridiales bacterium]